MYYIFYIVHVWLLVKNISEVICLWILQVCMMAVSIMALIAVEDDLNGSDYM